jgi:hypothetical protein
VEELGMKRNAPGSARSSSTERSPPACPPCLEAAENITDSEHIPEIILNSFQIYN